MYSYEISNILKENNYNINAETYINIIRRSPQINHVKYSPYGSYYEMWSDTGNYWKFTVYKNN